MLLCLIGGAMLILQLHAQKVNIIPFQVGERVPNLILKNVINYKDSTATLSSFGNKIIILDFWNTHCTTCIQMFPIEDSLQEVLSNKIQFILVTQDEGRKAADFLNGWSTIHKRKLSIPIVTDDQVLSSLFRYRFIPHYVWIAPTGEIMGQTSEAYINYESIRHVCEVYMEKMNSLEKNNYSEAAFTYPVLTEKMKELINQLQNQN